MKLVFASVLILSVAVAVLAQQKPELTQLSDRLMNAELRSATGSGSIKLAGSEKVIVLALWATWCGPCNLAIIELNKREAELNNRNVKVISLSTQSEDARDEITFFVVEQGITLPIAFGNEATKEIFAYRDVIPQILVLNQSGRVLTHFIGWNTSKTAAQLEEAVEKALASYAEHSD
jgi:peroxiredoxin